MYARTINNLSCIAAQLRSNYGLFPQDMDAESVCVKAARRLFDSCLSPDDILMLVRMSEDWLDFKGQLEDWESSIPANQAA